MNKWFYHLNQTKQEGDFKFSGLDLSFLKHTTDDYYCLINVVCSDIDIPKGKSVYIFAWLFEPFSEEWFDKIYKENPQSEFILLMDMDPGYLRHLPRIKTLQITPNVKWIETIKQSNKTPVKQSLDQRKYKISSLCSRFNEIRYYVTAQFLDYNSDEFYFTWNRGFDLKHSDFYVFENTDLISVDKLLSHKDYLLNNKINSKNFDNNPTDNSNFQHIAYQESVINSINETQFLSYNPDFGRLPAPYLTEKTWKPLFAGNALLFTGHPLTKQKLESYGFVFDYPWVQNYDESFNDLIRIELLLQNIQWIHDLPIGYLIDSCKHSVEHNLSVAWSSQFENMLYDINQQAEAELQRIL